MPGSCIQGWKLQPNRKWYGICLIKSRTRVAHTMSFWLFKRKCFNQKKTEFVVWKSMVLPDDSVWNSTRKTKKREICLKNLSSSQLELKWARFSRTVLKYKMSSNNNDNSTSHIFVCQQLSMVWVIIIFWLVCWTKSEEIRRWCFEEESPALSWHAQEAIRWRKNGINVMVLPLIIIQCGKMS